MLVNVILQKSRRCFGRRVSLKLITILLKKHMKRGKIYQEALERMLEFLERPNAFLVQIPHVSFFSPACLHLYIRLSVLDEHSERVLTAYIEQYRYLGYRVIGKELQEDMPTGYIGYYDYYYEGKLKYRRHLKIQEASSAKRILLEVPFP